MSIISADGGRKLSNDLQLQDKVNYLETLQLQCQLDR